VNLNIVWIIEIIGRLNQSNKLIYNNSLLDGNNANRAGMIGRGRFEIYSGEVPHFILSNQ
jgi:hypothetical protein